MKITNNTNKIELDIKRFYPPFDIEYKCPNCGHVTKFDDYISYPNINEPITFNCYCNECDKDWEEKILIEIKGYVIE